MRWAWLVLSAAGTLGCGDDTSPTTTGGGAGGSGGGDTSTGAGTGGDPSAGGGGAGAGSGGEVDCTGVWGAPRPLAAVGIADGIALVRGGLELYFSRDSGEGRTLVFRTTRGSTSESFGEATVVPELQGLCEPPGPGGSDLPRVTGLDVSEDGLRAYVSCVVDDPEFGLLCPELGCGVLLLERESVEASFEAVRMIGGGGFNVSVSSDELTMVANPPGLAPGLPPLIATRASLEDDFPPAEPVAMDLPSDWKIAGTTITPDDRTLIAGAANGASGGVGLVQMTRSQPGGAFGPPVPLGFWPEGTILMSPDISPDCRTLVAIRRDSEEGNMVEILER